MPDSEKIKDLERRIAKIELWLREEQSYWSETYDNRQTPTEMEHYEEPNTTNK